MINFYLVFVSKFAVGEKLIQGWTKMTIGGGGGGGGGAGVYPSRRPIHYAQLSSWQFNYVLYEAHLNITT